MNLNLRSIFDLTLDQPSIQSKFRSVFYGTLDVDVKVTLKTDLNILKMD